MNTKYRPRLSIYHANARGNGSMVQFELHPGNCDEDGYILAVMANQKPGGFDVANAISVRLGFIELAKMLQVFRGECESIDNDNGMEEYGNGANTIYLSHVIEPTSGYILKVRHEDGMDGTRNLSIKFTPAEAMGLTKAIEDSLGVICFGTQVVVEMY